MNASASNQFYVYISKSNRLFFSLFLYNSTKYEKHMREDKKKSVALKRLRSHSWLFHDFAQFTYFQSGTTCSYESALFSFSLFVFFSTTIRLKIQLNNTRSVYVTNFSRFEETDTLLNTLYRCNFGYEFMQFCEITRHHPRTN